MDYSEIARLRLRSQRLSGPQLDSAESVIGWLGAVQSQDYAPGKWSVGQRALGLRDADLDACLSESRILRTHILRPTWHFVLPADIRWMMALTAPRVNVQSRHVLGRSGLDATTLRRASDVLATALRGRRLPRPAIREALQAQGFATDGERLSYILMQAELGLLITSGGLSGKQQTYALLDEVAPKAASASASGSGGAPFERDEALAQLARRYFTSRGPATIADFTWWSSLTVADARRGLAILEGEIELTEIDGVSYWSAGIDLDTGEPSPRAHFMQGLDEYFVGYSRTRSAADLAGFGTTFFEGGFYSTVIIDGQVCVAVRRVVEKVGLTFEVRLMRDLTTDERGLIMAAADRYAEFLGAPVGVNWIGG